MPRNKPFPSAEARDRYFLHKGEMYIRHFERVLRRPDPKPHVVEKYPGDLIRRLRKARGVGQVKHIIKEIPLTMQERP